MTLIADKIAGDVDREMFGIATRDIVQRGRAVGVIMVTEAYYMKPCSLAELAELVYSGASLAERDGRREGVVVRLEHIRLSACWIGEIRNKRVEAFERLPEKLVGVGQFADLLCKERFA